MLNHFFGQPLSVKIGDSIFIFCSMNDFEFALNGRTEIPTKKVADLMGYTREHLRKEAIAIRELEGKIGRIISNTVEKPQLLNRCIKDLGLSNFTREHGWQDIMKGLCSGEHELNALLHVALVKYCKYLSSRQEMIRTVYGMKKTYQSSTAGNSISDLF